MMSQSGLAFSLFGSFRISPEVDYTCYTDFLTVYRVKHRKGKTAETTTPVTHTNSGPSLGELVYPPHDSFEFI